MSNANLDSVKNEIRFFMDKSFAVSFGYIGAIVALLAAVKFKVLEDAATSMHADEWSLLCGGVLVVNTVYLTVASSFLFAILKRGYFILKNTPASTGSEVDLDREWEVFVRKPGAELFESHKMNMFAWNCDNFYMVPIFILIIAISVGAVAYPWYSGDPLLVRAITSTLFAFNLLLPGAVCVATWHLNIACRKEYSNQHNSNS